MYKYTAIINYYDKNKAERTIIKSVMAKNMKNAKEKLLKLGKIKSISWTETPDLAVDKQLVFFADELE